MIPRRALIVFRPDLKEGLGVLADRAYFRSLDAQLAQSLKPQLCVLHLILSSPKEEGRNLFISRLLGHRGEIGILVAGLGLPGKHQNTRYVFHSI